MDIKRLSGFEFGNPKGFDVENNFTLLFDYVMVFPMVEIKANDTYEQSKEAKYYTKAMLDAGLCLYTYLSVQGDELIVLIHVPDEKLKLFTDLIDFPMMLDPDRCEAALAAGNPEAKIAPITINHDPTITPFNPHQYIFCKYESDSSEDLYFHYQGKLFPKFIKLKLLDDLLRAPFRGLGGAGIPINRLIHKKKITGYYPLHNKQLSYSLMSSQLKFDAAPWNQPFEEIRHYYGEKIALYNLFLGHYSLFLIAPSVVGFAFQLVVWGTLNFSHPVLPFFGVIITVGSIIMLEAWKRKEALTALKWGMSNFEDRELERPEFEGLEIKSFINGQEMIYFPTTDFQLRIQFSFSMIALVIMLVIGVVAGIYILRFSLQSSIGSNASVVASVLNTVQIVVFNMIYQILVTRLTDIENHRTDTSYQDSLIVKLFLFQFVNSYASFFFLAFIAQNLDRPDDVDSDFRGQCGYDNCMYPLSINLAIIFGSKLIITNTVALLQPWVMQRLKIRRETKGAEDKQLTPAESDYMLLPYNPISDNITNYSETAIQFGYMVLFITALPIGCMFSVINSYVKIRVDSYRMTHFYQRPIPYGAQDIGTWQDIFNLISIIAVITNGALICFTMDVLDNAGFTEYGKTWIFIGFQWTLISIQFVAAYAIPDVPEEVTIQLKRTEFISEKLILKVADEEFDESNETGGSESDVRSASGVDEDDELLNNAPVKKGFCGRSMTSKKGKKLKGADRLAPAPVFNYPFDKGSGWPQMLSSPSAIAKPPGQREKK